MRYKKETRIAIIGAGASGLTAALELKKKGYTNVVIFEKEDRVGGKTFSYEYKNEHFELGSMMFSRTDHSARLAKNFGIPFEPFETDKFYYSKKTFLGPFAYTRQRYSLPRILLALWRVKRIVAANHLDRPGLESASSELFQDFAAFSKANKIEPAARIFEPAITGLGYGFFNEIPALYVLKLMRSMLRYSLVWSLIRNGNMTCYFPGGWMALWEKVAALFDVRTGSTITSITRGDDRITITCNGRAEVFDKLLVTSPLNRLDQFLDLVPEEQALFARIRHYRTVSMLVQLSAPLPKTFFFADNTNAAHVGHVIGVEGTFPHTKAGIVFQIVPEHMASQDYEAIMRQDLRDVGCEVENIIAQKEWEYFYHVDTNALQEGFYPKLIALQGERNTFYSGSIFNYETVAHCEEYAGYVIEKYF